MRRESKYPNSELLFARSNRVDMAIVRHPSLKLLQDTSEKLNSFRSTPVMTCWGMRDFCFSPKFLEAWKDRWPHMMVHEMHHAGHYVLEDSYEECEARMKPFLLE